MDESSRVPRIMRFGAFEADLQAGELRKHGLRIKLQEQPFEILAILLQNPGELVLREDLRQRLWPADTFVDFDHSLNRAINKLRDALGDSAENPRFVETLPRRGYRFIAPVNETAPGAGHTSPPLHPVSATAEPAVVSVEKLRAEVRAAFGVHRWRKIALVAIAFGAILALLVVLNTGGWRQRLWEPSGPKPIQSIAVLPLENLSGDPTQEYFVDGMTEALITDLAQISALRVISRTSVMRYKGTKKSLPEIARELNVDAVVEGAVVQSGGRVRISGQLLHAATDRHLWAKSYERDLSNVVALQGEVARDIAHEIRVKLTPQEQGRLSSAHAVVPEAHEAYLKGRYYWNKRTPEGIKKALEYFQQAVEKDPGYALAYAGLADAYTVLSFNSDTPPGESYPRAKAAASKALEIDDTLAEAHASLGFTLRNYDWDWPGAEREFQRAIQLSPNYAWARQGYAGYLSLLGRHTEALTEAKRAQAQDPLSLIITSLLGRYYYHARQYDQAIEQCRKALEIDPNFWVAHLFLGKAYERKALYEEAIAEFQKAGSVTIEASTDIGYVYAVSGHRHEALKVLDKLTQLSKRRYVPSYHIARIYAGLGEKDEAFAWLEKAYAQRDGWLNWLRVDPTLDSLRSDPRFTSLLRRVGLPP